MPMQGETEFRARLRCALDQGDDAGLRRLLVEALNRTDDPEQGETLAAALRLLAATGDIAQEMAPLTDQDAIEGALVHNAYRIELHGESLRSRTRKPPPA